jgi:hypothetical protein
LARAWRINRSINPYLAKDPIRSKPTARPPPGWPK